MFKTFPNKAISKAVRSCRSNEIEFAMKSSLRARETAERDSCKTVPQGGTIMSAYEKQAEEFLRKADATMEFHFAGYVVPPL